MRAPQLYTAALARTAELRQQLRAGSTPPWRTAESHGRDFTDECWSEVAVLAPGLAAAKHSAYPSRAVALTAVIGWEDNETPQEDAQLIVSAVNALGRFLDLTDSILALHRPVTDPDGEAMCEHCVHVHEATHLWPCLLVDGVLDALEIPEGETDG